METINTQSKTHRAMAREITAKDPAKAFLKGMREIRVKDLPEVREALYKICRVSTPQGFRNYANGKVKNLTYERRDQITALFATYGVSSPWGL